MAEFDIDAAKRIVKSTRWVEDRYRNQVGRASSPTPNVYNKLGISTSPLTARVGKIPGFCTVQPYFYDPDINELVVVDDDDELVLNWTGSTADSGIWVHYMAIDGSLFLVGTDCSGVDS